MRAAGPPAMLKEATRPRGKSAASSVTAARAVLALLRVSATAVVGIVVPLVLAVRTATATPVVVAVVVVTAVVGAVAAARAAARRGLRGPLVLRGLHRRVLVLEVLEPLLHLLELLRRGAARGSDLSGDDLGVRLRAHPSRVVDRVHGGAAQRVARRHLRAQVRQERLLEMRQQVLAGHVVGKGDVAAQKHTPSRHVELVLLAVGQLAVRAGQRLLRRVNLGEAPDHKGVDDGTDRGEALSQPGKSLPLGQLDDPTACRERQRLRLLLHEGDLSIL